MKKADNKIDYLELPAQNVEILKKSQKFFNEAFGWTYQSWGEDYVDTQESGLASGINADNPPQAPLPVIYVKDIRAAYENVSKAGGTIIKEIFPFPGGQRFHFTDPAGNEIAAWSK